MADQFSGKNLALTIGGVTVTCPQSFEVTSNFDFLEYYCVASSAKQRVLNGTDWTASCVWFPENNDQTDISDFNNTATAAVVVYPDGATAGNIKITFDAYSTCGLNTSRGSVGSSTINFIIDGDVTFEGA